MIITNVHVLYLWDSQHYYMTSPQACITEWQSVPFRSVSPNMNVTEKLKFCEIILSLKCATDNNNKMVYLLL